MRARTPLVPLLVACLAAPAGAQVSSVTGPPKALDPKVAAGLVADMSADLKALAAAQKRWFAEHDRYGERLSRTDARAVVLEPRPGVTVTLTYVTASSFAARATHDWLPGRSCVMTVGAVPPSRLPRTTAGRLEPTRDGEPVCDRP